MDGNTRSNTGTGLGIAGLVLGILSIPLGIMGCTFILGLVLGIMGVTLSAVGLSQARKANSQSGLILAGLIVSIIGTSFAMVRLTGVITRTRDKVDFWKEKLEKYEDNSQAIKDNVNDIFNKDFEDTNTKKMQDQLEKLEQDINTSKDKTQKQIDSTIQQLNNTNEKNKKDKPGKGGK